MKTFIFAIFITVAGAFSQGAWAQNLDDAFDFQIITYNKAGCLGLEDVWTPDGFTFPEGRAQVVRLLYSKVSPEAVNADSEHFEFTISEDGTSLDTNGELCGLESGKRYYFKGQLLTKDRTSLFVTPDSSFNPERHTNVVP